VQTSCSWETTIRHALRIDGSHPRRLDVALGPPVLSVRWLDPVLVSVRHLCSRLEKRGRLAAGGYRLARSKSTPRNDPRQYDRLSGEWWKPSGSFAALHWLADSRAELIPAPARPDLTLVDVGCGGGLLATHMPDYRHVGIDLSARSLRVAANHGVVPVRADAGALPLRDQVADVVVAGELFEHVPDLPRVIAEIARVLRPEGVLIFDTINDTLWSRLSLVIVGERLPGGPPPRIHDPSLFVRPSRLAELLGRHGFRVRVRGLRPSLRDYASFLVGRRDSVRMLPTRSLASVYQGVGSRGS
jgi:2-polyprenyl-6-hydroxyphenyl methylase / 3-demethylubiquinone-9 3-methyltransferase